MLALVRQFGFMQAAWANHLYEHEAHKVLAFERGGLVFVFHFDPVNSRPDYLVSAPSGKYRMVLDTDDTAFGGHGRLAPQQEHYTLGADTGAHGSAARLSLYLPSRTSLVLVKVD